MGITRFIDAQKESHTIAVKELKNGLKQSCWMWYTFPQIKGLAHTNFAKFYEIQSKKELKEFSRNKYLSKNLMECMQAALSIKTNDAEYVFGVIDARKLQSSMTLFRHIKKFEILAQSLLDKYFNGEIDTRTEAILATLKEES